MPTRSRTKENLGFSLWNKESDLRSGLRQARVWEQGMYDRPKLWFEDKIKDCLNFVVRLEARGLWRDGRPPKLVSKKKTVS